MKGPLTNKLYIFQKNRAKFCRFLLCKPRGEEVIKVIKFENVYALGYHDVPKKVKKYREGGKVKRTLRPKKSTSICEESTQTK